MGVSDAMFGKGFLVKKKRKIGSKRSQTKIETAGKNSLLKWPKRSGQQL